MKLLRKKRFWIAIILLLIFSITFDLVVLNVWAVRSITSGVWDIRLVIAGALLVISDGIGYVHTSWKTRITPYTRLMFFVLIVMAVSIHGFSNGLVYMSLILILSRLIRILVWVVKKVIRKFRRRGLLEEI